MKSAIQAWPRVISKFEMANNSPEFMAIVAPRRFPTEEPGERIDRSRTLYDLPYISWYKEWRLRLYQRIRRLRSARAGHVFLVDEVHNGRLNIRLRPNIPIMPGKELALSSINRDRCKKLYWSMCRVHISWQQYSVADGLARIQSYDDEQRTCTTRMVWKNESSANMVL